MRRFEPAFLTVCLWWIPAMAGGAVTLPLQGYCKPGYYFPIQVDGPDCSRNITFSAGASPGSNMESQAGSRVIVPLLVGDEPHELVWNTAGLPLRIPEADERLIAGLSSDQIAAAAALFPGKRLLPIQLDPADPLPGPPVAWEALDGMILQKIFFQRISDIQRSALLSGGATLISIGSSPPDDRWPWRQCGSLWFLSAELSGPRGGLVDQNVYTPTFNWTPGWPASVRGQVVSIAALMVLMTIALALRPTRATFWITALLLMLTTAGVISWRHALGTVDRAGGDILVTAHGLVQRDAYLYQRAHEATRETVPWNGSTRPIFSSQTSLNQANLQLDLSSTGHLCFTYDAQRGHTIAFLRRSIQPGDLAATNPSPNSPILDLAKLEYLRANDVVTGAAPSTEGRWPGVVIQRH